MRNMQGLPMRAGWIAGLALAALSGCAEGGVGDPCIPEAIPCSTDPATGQQVCGYDPDESYVEASSVQCRTRTCVVYKLSGDPREICATPENPNGSMAENCVPPQELDDRVYCSCRCSAPDDVVGNFDLCSCPSGFSCENLLAKGGDGIRGGYCVKDVAELGE